MARWDVVLRQCSEQNGQSATTGEWIMETSPALAFGSCEEINNEIRRRALFLAQRNAEMRDDEDPYVAASREIFEELLRRFSEHAAWRAA